MYSLNIVRNLETLNLTWIEKKLPRKPMTKYIILLEEELSNPDEPDLLQVFAEIWDKQVLNALIIYWNGSACTAVTFRPFPILSLDFIQGNELHNHTRLFWDKARNLYGAPLKVVGFYDSSRARFDQKNTNNLTALDGLDGLLTRLIVDKMNASLILSEPEDGMEIGELLPNKSATGCLKELMSGKIDLGLNVRFYRLNHFEGKVEATHAIGRDDICFLVPRKGKAPDFANIFRPFQKYTWLSIFGSLPCYVFAFYMLVRKKYRLRSFQYFMVQFYAYMLQQSATYLPTTFRQKTLIIFWVGVSFSFL